MKKITTFNIPVCLTIMLLLAATGAKCQTNKDTAASPEIGVAIKPALFNFRVAKGEKATMTGNIINSQPTPLQVKLYLGDWMRDSLGNHQYVEANTLPVSCARWVTLSRSFIEVPANSTVDFDVSLSVPDSAGINEFMRWSMLFVEYTQETTAPQVNARKITTEVVKKQRIGLHIYQTPPQLNGKEFKMIAFEAVPKAKNTYRMVCQNTGNLQISCNPYLELTSLNEAGTTTKITGQSFPMFPGQRRIVSIAIPDNLPKGKYNAVAAIDAGEDVPLEAAQEEITVN